MEQTNFKNKIEQLTAMKDLLERQNQVMQLHADAQALTHSTLSDTTVREAETVRKIKLIDNGDYDSMLKTERPKPPTRYDFNNPCNVKKKPLVVDDDKNVSKDIMQKYYSDLQTIGKIQESLGKEFKTFFDTFGTCLDKMSDLQAEMYKELK